MKDMEVKTDEAERADPVIVGQKRLSAALAMRDCLSPAASQPRKAIPAQ
jgi:hypothetical protein